MPFWHVTIIQPDTLPDAAISDYQRNKILVWLTFKENKHAWNSLARREPVALARAVCPRRVPIFGKGGG